jgi:bifunctional non-homologous end joining protein LigD
VTLKKYREKRKFQETPEPEGGQHQGRGPLRFVVQLHRATRLHFDFRLELEGTLKSWAVPKGPSNDPQERRLAVMVEDHPLEYQSFEGIIPKGNYGAGTVMVWDNGTYYSRQTPDREESERVLLDGLKKGHITFILEGRKLKGEFALVRLKRGEENAWLLLKKGDAFANAKDVLEFDRSVLTNRSLDEIAQQAPAKQEIWHSKPKTPLPALGNAPPGNMLHQVKPMLATYIFVASWLKATVAGSLMPGPPAAGVTRMWPIHTAPSPVRTSTAPCRRSATVPGAPAELAVPT